MNAVKIMLAGTALASAFAIAPVQAEGLKVAAVSGYFAQGFGVSIVQGLERAQQELGVELKIVDTGNRALDYEEQFNNLAKDGQFDVIFVMGWELVDALTKTHAAYPDQKFVFIDGVLDSPNMTYVDFVEEEGSFLVGSLSAMLTEQKVAGFDSSSQIGFVGGRDIPVIRNFLSGLEQGAAHITDQVDVEAVFAGTFDDPAKGSEVAMTLYDQGVDVIYQAAGPTGEGVLQAARAAGKYAVGVDVDQCPSAPGNMLASMLKRADIAVFDLLKGVSEGNALPTGAVEYGVANGAVEVKVCDEVKDKIPAEITTKLEDVRQGIADGTITVARNS